MSASAARTRPASVGSTPTAPPSAKTTPATRTGTPLYLQLTQTLRSEIRRGVHPVGSLLPPEIEMAHHHGVSRQTVRQAIAVLRSEGLVSARKGVGTRVEGRTPPDRFTYSISSVEELVEMARDSETTIEASEWIVARGALAAELGCRPSRKWLHLTCTSRADGSILPYAAVSIFIDHRIATGLKLPSPFRTALFMLLENHSGEKVAEIEQEIRATIIGEDLAERLEAPVGAPALELTRRFFGSGRRLMMVAVNTLPSDRFFYSVMLKRS